MARAETRSVTSWGQQSPSLGAVLVAACPSCSQERSCGPAAEPRSSWSACCPSPPLSLAPAWFCFLWLAFLTTARFCKPCYIPCCSFLGFLYFSYCPISSGGPSHRYWKLGLGIVFWGTPLSPQQVVWDGNICLPLGASTQGTCTSRTEICSRKPWGGEM